MSLSFVEPSRRRSASRSRRSLTPVSSAVRSPSRSAMRSSSRISSESTSQLSTPRAESPSQHKFQKRVGFDTFDNKDATDFSLTLQAKQDGYVYSRLSRTFLCGTDQNDYSEFALEWLIDELVDDGDEIVCLRVVDPNSKISSSDTALQEKLYRDEAYKLLNDIMDKNEDDKKISLILEYAVGKVQDMIQRMIEIYEPAVLIVGTRGKSLNGFSGLLPGSISKYCLQHSPVPVIVVRPSNKREKKKAKRQADPTRRAYHNIVENKNAGSTRTLTDKSHETVGRTSAQLSKTPEISPHTSTSTLVPAPVPTDNLEKLGRVVSAPEVRSVTKEVSNLSLVPTITLDSSDDSPAAVTTASSMSMATSAAITDAASAPTPDLPPDLPPVIVPTSDNE
ncbi:uncharacterized protein V1518DRAFT_420247 [Limtongia smithiae]|uniref:uncharacterized protein n=1 Tax=Limtongia smithiae TaxID=1125753 RepID=UPI0034CFCE68